MEQRAAVVLVAAAHTVDCDIAAAHTAFGIAAEADDTVVEADDTAAEAADTVVEAADIVAEAADTVAEVGIAVDIAAVVDTEVEEAAGMSRAVDRAAVAVDTAPASSVRIAEYTCHCMVQKQV